MTNLTNPIFHDDEAARKHLEGLRWPNGPVCPHCKGDGADVAPVANTGKKIKPVAEGKKHRPARAGLYYCKPCEKTFTVTMGSIMEKSHIPISKWMLGFFLMSSSKKGMSSHQLHRMLHITYKSAWFMAHRIREAMDLEPETGGGPMGGEGKTVESDETYVGGKAKNAKKGKPIPKKSPVVALVERGGKLRAKHVPNMDSKNIREVLKRVDQKTHLMTDDSLIYYHIGPTFAKHDAVNHSAKLARRFIRWEEAQD